LSAACFFPAGREKQGKNPFGAQNYQGSLQIHPYNQLLTSVSLMRLAGKNFSLPTVWQGNRRELRKGQPSCSPILLGIIRFNYDRNMAKFGSPRLYGLEDLGFVPRGEAGRLIAERNTAPGGKLPLNTNGGGLSYMHCGVYGMYALQESVRQMRGIPPPRSSTPRSRSATASAACSPPPAPSSCRTSRLE
jgi:hypothetical protein